MPHALNRVLIFLLLSYAFTWFGWLGNAIWPSDYWLLPMNPFGPLMAAPLAIWLTEGAGVLKAWLKRLIQFRAPVWVYATAILGPLAIILASVALSAATGARIQPLPDMALLDFLIVMPIVLISGPGPEELSFRGYAQHELQKSISPLVAALLIGAGVAVWHAPLVLIGAMGWPMVICIIAVSVVYAWLYNMGGSIWPVVALHFSVNYFGPEYFGSMVAEPSGQFVYRLFFVMFHLAWAGWIVWKFGPSLNGRGHPRLATA